MKNRFVLKKESTISREIKIREMKMMQSVCSSPELMDARFSQLRLPASSSSKSILLIKPSKRLTAWDDLIAAFNRIFR